MDDGADFFGHDAGSGPCGVTGAVTEPVILGNTLCVAVTSTVSTLVGTHVKEAALGELSPPALLAMVVPPLFSE